MSSGNETAPAKIRTLGLLCEGTERKRPSRGRGLLAARAYQLGGVAFEDRQLGPKRQELRLSKQ